MTLNFALVFRDTDGRAIVTLPHKQIEIVWIEMDEAERSFYEVGL